MEIYLDFDGTVVEHQFPKIGMCNFGCMEVIKKLQDAGHDIILNTYRANISPAYLNQALDYLNVKSWMLFKERNEFNALNPIIKHTKEKIHPLGWTFCISEGMIDGVFFIDDQAAGTPLKPAAHTPGMMVDWDKVDEVFDQIGIYKQHP